MVLVEHDIRAADGTELRLREAPCEGATEAVVLVHGATYPSLAAFGSPGGPTRPWPVAIADGDRAGFAVDLRGYGDSERPEAFERSPSGTATVPSRASDAAVDVEAAVSAVGERFDRVHLVGYSWGTIVCGRYLTHQEGTVASLTQFAPVYRPSEMSERWDAGDPPSPSRRVTREAAKRRWDRQLPGDDPSAYRPDGAFEAFWTALSASDQHVPDAEQPTIAAPNGTLLDLQAAARGDPVYDAGEISVPTLVVRGTLDSASTRRDALGLYDELGCSDEREYGEIAGGTHFLPLEHRGSTLFGAVSSFQDRA